MAAAPPRHLPDREQAQPSLIPVPTGPRQVAPPSISHLPDREQAEHARARQSVAVL